MSQGRGRGDPWANRGDVGLNKIVQPECLYCAKKFTNMGPMRPHLRKHIGIRPYKCAQCDYNNWQKCTILADHFVLAHGRKAVETDALTNVDEEKALEDQVEADVIEIRENQMKKK